MSYALARGTRWELSCEDAHTLRLRRELAHEYELARGRRPTRPQLDGLVGTWRWLEGCIRADKLGGGDGTMIVRSTPRIA